MKVKTLLCICALLFSLAVAAQSPQPERYPKREFRAAWIQAVNGQFRGIPTEKLKQTLINQLNSLQEAGINAIIFQLSVFLLLPLIPDRPVHIIHWFV